MAINAAVVFECQTGGSDDNGGGFKTGATGVDYSQQTAAQATLTTASTVNATTTIIDVAVGDHTVSTNDVGNIYQNTGGTSTAGYYEITAVNVGANQWTVDRAIGTVGQTLTGNMGGCLASPGGMAAAMSVDGNTGWLKAGTYTLTTVTAGKGGPVTLTFHGRIEGYQTTRGDRGTKPVISAGTQTTISVCSVSASKVCTLVNIKVDGNGQVGVNGFTGSNAFRNRVVYCDSVNCSDAGSYGFTGACLFLYCYAKDCDSGFQASGNATHCAANDCSIGFKVGSGSIVENCLVYGTNSNAFSIASTGAYALRCTAIGSSSNGFSGSTSMCVATECIASGCATGFRTTGTRVCDVNRCFTWNNTADSSGTFLNYGVTVLTADPFVNAAGEDYRPNNTAGGGASIRACAPGIPYQTNNLDCGAVQHSDPTSGGVINHPGLSFGSL